MPSLPIRRAGTNPQTGVIVFDDQDTDLMAAHKWYFSTRGYPVTMIKTGDKWAPRPLHRIILGNVVGREIDHINRNKLDNRRINLRVVTRRVNAQNAGLKRNNRSGYRGVSAAAGGNRRAGWLWRAEATVDGRKLVLAYSKDLLFSAALAATWRAFYMPGAQR